MGLGIYVLILMSLVALNICLDDLFDDQKAIDKFMTTSIIFYKELPTILAAIFLNPISILYYINSAVG